MKQKGDSLLYSQYHVFEQHESVCWEKSKLSPFCFLLAMISFLSLVPSLHADSAKTSLTGVLGQRFNQISDRLVCQCNCNMILRVCNHINCPSGIPMREEIEAKLQDGMSDDAIVEGFVQKIGARVLSEPPARGAYWIAWVLPFAALLLGALGLILWLKKKKENGNGKPPVTPFTPEEDEKFNKEWDEWTQQS